jgi:cyclopropane-fatty-acyl-phospholipid synthase
MGFTHALPRTGFAALLASLDIPGEIKLPTAEVIKVGNGEPK